jgi:prepilin-type N-terminal cleavage/methylation domain-containing protein
MESLYRYINQGMRPRNGQHGLTLVEILVVVTVLGILTGTVTLSLVSLTSHARAQSCNQGRPTVQGAIAPNRPTTISTPPGAHPLSELGT